MLELIHKIDDSIYNRLSCYKKNILTAFFSYIGNVIIVGFFVVLLLIIPATTRLGVISAAGLFFSTIIVFILKYSVKKNRKNYDNNFVKKFDPYSFPSGHAGRLAVFIITLSNVYLVILFSLLTIVVSIARISKGYHQSSDCAVGIITGLFSGILAVMLSWFYLDFLMNFILPVQKILFQ